MNLGYILRRIRNIKRYSLTDLSSKTGLSKASLSNIEIGKNNPTIDTLNKICNALEISTTQLLSLIDEIDTSKISVDEENIDATIIKYLINDQEHSNSNLLANDYSSLDKFNSAEESVKFILSQPSVGDYGNFDVNKLTDEDKINFANDLLEMIKLLSGKYRN